MRIADKMMYDQTKLSLAKNRTDMAELQNQAATQKKVNKPSDDPLAATRVLAARTDINTGSQFLKNINAAKSFLEFSDQSLGELAEVLMRAKELAINQSNDASASEQTRTVTASEVSQLHDQSVQIGNRKLGDRFLFGGFRTTQAPFDPKGNYRGDDGEMRIIINKDATVTMNVPGSQVFLGKEVEPQATVGVDPTESFPPSRDLPPTTDPIFPWTDRSKLPENDPSLVPEGEAVSLPPLRNPASVPTKSPDDPARGEGQFSDSWKTKGLSVFKVLKDLETGLRTNDKASIQDSLDSIDAALAQVILGRSQVGSRVMTLNSAMVSLQKGQVDSKSMASSLEDADTFELVSDMNKTESTLRASLATSSKLIQPSLLDFLR